MSVEFAILFVISSFLSSKEETFLVVGRRHAGDEQSTYDAENCALLGYQLKAKKILGFFTLEDGLSRNVGKEYYYTLGNSPEEGCSRLLHSGSLQSDTAHSADKSVLELRICDELYTDFAITSALLSENNCFNVLFVINSCLCSVRSQRNYNIWNEFMQSQQQTSLSFHSKK